VAPQFIAPPPFFAGPQVDLKAFKQQLIPPDIVGETLPTAGAGVFGTPVTLVEYKACNPAVDVDDLNGAGNTGPAEIEDCQPAIVDKLFVMAPATQDAKFRIQLALCNNAKMADHQNDGTPDNDPTNDRCGPAGGQNEFNDASIVMDVVFQLFADHTEKAILDIGAINPGTGNTLMARAADNTAGNQDVNVWVGLERVGSEGAFDFVNPAVFGGVAPTACVEFTIRTNLGVAIQGATVSLSIPPLFSDVKLTDGNGKARFTPVPDGFAIVDLFVANKPPFFLDRPVFAADHNLATAPNNANADANCNETVFNLPIP